jgi:hypothetical protein
MKPLILEISQLNRSLLTIQRSMPPLLKYLPKEKPSFIPAISVGMVGRLCASTVLYGKHPNKPMYCSPRGQWWKEVKKKPSPKMNWKWLLLPNCKAKTALLFSNRQVKILTESSAFTERLCASEKHSW